MKIKRELVVVIWTDACITFGKDHEKLSPGEEQVSYGVLHPKTLRNRHGQAFYRILQNEGDGQDDFTDIPKAWVTQIIKVGSITKVPIQIKSATYSKEK